MHNNLAINPLRLIYHINLHSKTLTSSSGWVEAMNLLCWSNLYIVRLITIFTSYASIHDIEIGVYYISLLSALVLTSQECVST